MEKKPVSRVVIRVLAVVGGLLLFYATTLTDIIGVGLFGLAIGLHLWRTDRGAS